MMTNEELAQAIEVADQRVKQCGTGQPRYEPLLQHLKALLSEQRRRAEAAVPALPQPPQPGPFVQPVIVQPTWAPKPAWEPPWTVTCGGSTN